MSGDDWKFEPSNPGCDLRTFIQEAVGAASVCWENFGSSGQGVNSGVFLERQATAIADAVYERAMAPEGARMGMATTDDLLRELEARMRRYSHVAADMVRGIHLVCIDLNIPLTYRTVDPQ